MSKVTNYQTKSHAEKIEIIGQTGRQFKMRFKLPRTCNTTNTRNI